MVCLRALGLYCCVGVLLTPIPYPSSLPARPSHDAELASLQAQLKLVRKQRQRTAMLVESQKRALEEKRAADVVRAQKEVARAAGEEERSRRAREYDRVMQRMRSNYVEATSAPTTDQLQATFGVEGSPLRADTAESTEAEDEGEGSEGMLSAAAVAAALLPPAPKPMTPAHEAPVRPRRRVPSTQALPAGLPPPPPGLPTATLFEDGAEPTAAEIREYSAYLGLDPVEDRALLPVAIWALCAPLPAGCSAHDDKAGNEYFFNTHTGVSSYEHPLDAQYKAYLQVCKQAQIENAVCGLAIAGQVGDDVRKALKN